MREMGTHSYSLHRAPAPREQNHLGESEVNYQAASQRSLDNVS